jgi:hypothetical protein
VPSTALVARRRALLDVAVDGKVFDESLRYGEDVDLVWRLHCAGWRVRYDPSVEVSHDEPMTWRSMLVRRFRYGTSAAPLSRRHPDATQPLSVPILPALTVAAVLSRRPFVAAATAAAGVASARRVRRGAGLDPAGATADVGRAIVQTWAGVGRYAAQFLMPLVVAACACGDRRTRYRRIAAAAALIAAPAVAGAMTSPRSLDPVRLTVAGVADDIAYGAGVCSGCVRERTLSPIRPRIRGLRPAPRPDRRTSTSQRTS